MDKINLPIILGTERKGRESKKVADYLLTRLSEYSEITSEIIDIRNLDLSMSNGSLKDKNPEYQEKIENADGIIIVSPEYNHSFPGSLKSAIDILSAEYKHKPVGIAGVSSGSFGGARMIENLIPILVKLGIIVSSNFLYFGNVNEIFSENGSIVDETYSNRVSNFVDELIWLSDALRWGRENL